MPAADGMMAPATAPGASTGERLPVLAFLCDEESETTFRTGLSGRTGAITVRRGTIRTAIAALEREPTPHILVVDLSGEENPSELLDRLSAVCTPDVTVLAVGDRSDIGFYREIQHEFGIAEYLFKPLTRDNVARLFGPHITGQREEAAQRGNRVVAVCGVRGGTGATTVAVNLAVLLADSTRSHVALLDLHLRGGSAAMMLGVRSTAGLRVVLEDPDRVDPLFVERAAVPIGDRLRLLSADEPPEADPAPKAAGALRLLEILRNRFNLVIVDLPWPPGPVERAVLEVARHRVLVFRPDVAGLRDAAAARAMLTAKSAGDGPILLVQNGAGAPGSLETAMVLQALGAAPDITIPHLPRHLPRAADLGQPAVRGCAPLRRALAPLAQEVNGTRQAVGNGLLGRILGRWAR
ncbi:AAA family ATPase [Roseicella aerolata]|uniref:P-loop NTPase n=1 Tax=Roseicella aerolata TaxID=2883479 RepID=A0A9X1IHJ0_9PROT|nr:P-loop NTPase [Roseicella aerolata]MCB4824764.1 P-loop NTPase [Roseicella aerolata]